MKPIIIVLFSTILFVGCGSNTPTETTPAETTPVVTTPALVEDEITTKSKLLLEKYRDVASQKIARLSKASEANTRDDIERKVWDDIEDPETYRKIIMRFEQPFENKKLSYEEIRKRAIRQGNYIQTRYNDLPNGKCRVAVKNYLVDIWVLVDILKNPDNKSKEWNVVINGIQGRLITEQTVGLTSLKGVAACPIG